jgi:hypothetical protein
MVDQTGQRPQPWRHDGRLEGGQVELDLTVGEQAGMGLREGVLMGGAHRRSLHACHAEPPHSPDCPA